MKKRDLVMADITTLYETHARAAVTFINTHRGQEFGPQLIAVWMADQPGCMREGMFIDPDLVSTLHRDAQGKDALMCFVRLLLRQGSEIMRPNNEAVEFMPDAVIHISECWELRRRSHEIEGGRAGKYLDGHPSLSEHPDRSEALMVTVHTLHKSYIGFCLIEGDGADRVATFQPLDPAVLMTGRMSLNPEGSHAQH